MGYLDERHSYLVDKIRQTFPALSRSAIESYLQKEDVYSEIESFFKADGVGKLLFVHQVREEETEGGDWVQIGDKPELHLTTGEKERVKGKCCYFVRVAEKGVDKKTVENDVMHGEIIGSALETFSRALLGVYRPVLGAQKAWGENPQDATQEFLQGFDKFNEVVTEAVNSLEGGIELRKPEKQYAEIENKPTAFTKAAGDQDVVDRLESVMEDWITQTERLLNETDGGAKAAENDEVGPYTEFDYWRNRMAKFNSIAEQLKTKECKVVLGVLSAARSRLMKKWKFVDNAITDALNEAKDNVRILGQLERYIDPLYTGTPDTIRDALPPLMNNIKLMLTIARYYNTSERMTSLFVKITNQVITNCKKTLTDPGDIWDQDVDVLLKNLESCLKLNEAYQEQYRLTRDKLLNQPKGKQFDFNESMIFGKFDLFCKRINKLMDMFTTVQQFTTLAKHNIEGMEPLIKNFFDIIGDFKRKPYDLLDYTKSQFDRDYLEYNVNISELETALQGFINASFENISSTEHALGLLKQFESILQRETLRTDLDSKYTVIFHNYGIDLDTVQKIYDKQKNNPPMVRNAPPVAGNILWARQLLRKIEEPMRKFKSNKNIMNTKESKKIVRTYNRVARALIEFETLWHHAWMKSIEAAKAGLQATLLVRHPKKGKLYVNFDNEILQLIRETKCLQRMGVEVPESAKMVLLQEDKFKSYYNQLTFALKEFERVMSKINPVVKPLLAPHLDDLSRKIQPGMLILTWQSMNIDGYLHRIHTGLAKFEELLNKISDIANYRIEQNLKIISNTLLVNLPTDESFTLEAFVGLQDKTMKRKTAMLARKNTEVEIAVNDLIELVRGYPLELTELTVSDEDARNIKEHYSRLMYLAIVNATKNSFQALKKRLGNKSSGGFLFIERPFFDVDVELTIPNVTMNPHLDDIQGSINSVASNVLKCSKKLFTWNINSTDNINLVDARKEVDQNRSTFYVHLARDKEIMKVIILLTGSIEGIKKEVIAYLDTFKNYDFLWKEDKQVAYQAFMKSNPEIEQFERELKKYMEIENQISSIAPVHNIGPLSLETQPLKYSLKSEARQWKHQYAENLHEQARTELNEKVDSMRRILKKLERHIGDLEDVRDVMNTLKEVRDQEAEKEMELAPVKDKYALLNKYEVRLPKDETELEQDLDQIWEKVLKTANSVNAHLSKKQSEFKRDLEKSVKQFVIDVQQFRKAFETEGPIVPGIPPAEANERLRKFQRLYEVKERLWKMYSDGEELFGLPVTEYPELEETQRQLILLDKLYSLYTAVTTKIEGYADRLWAEVVSDIEQMQTQVEQFQNNCKRLPKALREWDAYTELSKTINDFSEILPLLTQLSSDAIMPRHWQQIFQITGKQIKNFDSDSLKLQHILDLDLVPHLDEIEEVCNAAVKEKQIEKKLKTIRTDWQEMQFEFAQFKNKGPVTLKGSTTSEIVEKLEDSQMNLGSMLSNRYSGPFREEVQEWITKLSTVSEIIEQWQVVQSMWIYMEAVFAGGDIAKQLPAEAKRFAGIDKNYLKIMTKAFEIQNVVNTCYGNDLMKNLLPHLQEQLEIIQKSLTGYLETKRNLFPRFYFVSDPVLLEILSQGSDPHAIQPHLQSCFDGLCQLHFDKNDTVLATHFSSGEGEKVKLIKPVKAQGNIEDWLTRLLDASHETIQDLNRGASRECLDIRPGDLVSKYPAQHCLLCISMQWTHDCQDAITRARSEKGAMSSALKKCGNVLSDFVNLTTTELTPLMRTNVESCITIQVHNRDIFDELVKKKIRDPSDFEWLKQARTYFKPENDETVISITDVDFEYCNEYLGCKERLVITPLTDRCYITLSQALGMYLGGAPAGPAGTGKTETVKDCSRLLGKYIVVFNCSDQMDFRAMGKIYKGLAQSGAWGCFDEFNRIELEVLSVCAQQVNCVLTACRDHKKEFVFTDGQTVRLDEHCGFFITMNPGYAGRQELPENLKTLFRGCAMMVPDRRIIMKVKLAAAGFQGNEILSKKFNVLYRLCEQQLSKQIHYDFGLRNILSVLRTAGATKRKNPDKSETLLLMRTLRDMNLSKFVAEDVPLFLSLIKDLFPGIQGEKATFPDIEAAIEKRVKESGLQHHASWVTKVIQLYETYMVRHGIMLTGPSGGGKSTILKILSEAFTEIGTKHQIWRMNPKAITAPEMFGRLDPVANDWKDGIFASLWRKANKQKSSSTFLVLDGPVDTLWIENLNTVLDDNKLLTLANGDRIPMAKNLKLMFENENLNNASPATVSRAGIIFISATDLGWQPVAQSWLEKRRDQEKEIVGRMIEQYCQAAFDFIRKECKSMMALSPVGQIGTLTTLLDHLLKGSEESKDAANEEVIERVFIFALCWSLGSLLELKDRTKFDSFLRGLSQQIPEVSAQDTVYEYFVDPATSQWTHWNERVPEWQYPEGEEKVKFSQLMIPTLDSVRYEYCLRTLTEMKRPALLIGDSGTTKTATVQQFLMSINPDEFSMKNITFSSATTPKIFQRTVESSVEKRQGRTFGPLNGKKCVMFIDDCSMPEINSWGDQITNELFRQLIEDEGFYDLDKPGVQKNIVDCMYVAAMNHPGGGKNDIPNRLKRHFGVFNVTMPSLAAIDNIYGSMTRGRFSPTVFAGRDDVLESAQNLVPASIQLWQLVAAKMLPTPANFHYIFNMRDLSRIFQGVLTCPTSLVTNAKTLVNLWMHECERVFSDKLTAHADKNWLRDTLRKVTEERFGKAVLQEVEQEFCVFANFMQDPTEDDDGVVIDEHPKVYEPVPSIETVRERVYDFQKKYNDDHKIGKLDLVLFGDALDHLLRISRIICMDRGSVMLVGVGGSGKQSLTRLASYIAGYYTFQITVTKTYNVMNLFEDLKGLYKIAGLVGRHVTFIFTDAEVKEEGFLEYINQILATGEVAGLYQKDEIDVIVNDMRGVVKKEKLGIIDTYDNMYKLFLDRVRDNLHVVLCFSPVGEQFAARARKFPGLFSACSIDWLLPWPEEALFSVAEKFLGDFKMATTDEIKRKMMQHMSNVHKFVVEASGQYFDKFRRHVYVTPKSYLSFIGFYKEVYVKKHAEVKSLADKINAGLGKLLEAAEDVEKMKIDLQAKEIDLQKAQQASQELLGVITHETGKAEKKKAEVQGQKDIIQKDADIISAEKAQAQTELDAAKPALEEAEAALKNITAKDIQNLKALKNPPDIIKRIFDGVIILNMKALEPIQMVEVKGNMQYKDSYSLSALPMMSSIDFLPGLMNFERDQINEETVELLQPYLAAEDFNYESAFKSSKNAAGLCSWVRAMAVYFSVARDVRPKIDALRESEAKLNVATKKLNAALAELDEAEQAVKKLQDRYDAAMSEKQRLEADAENTKKKIDSANALINGLAGERQRWTEQSKQFEDEINRLVGDVAMACAFMSYTGPFNKEFREGLIRERFYNDLVTRSIPATKDIQVTTFLVDDSEVGEWNLQGLPTDELSVQNGILVTRAARYPILIDPQGQGAAWIKSKEAANSLKVTQLGDKHFRNHLEDCLSYGKPLLIEDIEEIVDPVLDPVLDKSYVRSGKGWKIALADKEVDYEETFRLFLTTKIANPHYTPELSARTTIIDFTVTMKGLEDQLLGRVVQKERAELQEERQNLAEEVTSYKKKIKELEDDLLYRLSSSSGNLLEDTELIGVLSKTKVTAQEVSEKLIAANENNVRITNACEDFRPVATRGSVIYFLISELRLIDPMYNTSLNQFLAVFENSIMTAEKAGMVQKRIANIISTLTYNSFLYIQRGLFERHKLLFVLLLTIKIQLENGSLSNDEFQCFLKGGAALDINAVKKKPKDWIPDMSWLHVNALAAAVPVFRDLPESMSRSDAAWKTWWDQENPEVCKVPEYEERITTFQRLLLVRSLREDRTLIMASAYVAETIGQRYTDSIPLNLEAAMLESTNRIPFVFLLSPGSDPTNMITEVAKKKKIGVPLSVSMGQGQEVIARRYLATATTQGGWVLLQNTHLGLKFLPEVEHIIAKQEDIHEDFRLLITSEPHPKFPIGLLQMSLKITNEAPAGLRAGLKRSYAWINQDTLDSVPRHEWRQLLYVQCFLHSVVQERRKFGPIGWNIPYEFNQSDLSASVQFIQNHLSEMEVKKSKEVTWTTVRYMVAEIQYGGRITDDYDRRLMNTYCEIYFHQAALDPNFKFYEGYKVPQSADVNVFRQQIEQMSKMDNPEIFGLHGNADITYRVKQTNEALDTILDTQPKGGGSSGGGMTREEVVNNIAEDLLRKLPNDFKMDEVFEKTAKEATAPLTVFLRQEIDRLQRVLKVTRSTLKDLQLAIAGTIVLNERLIEALNYLYDARVPPFWVKVSWEATTLGLWFTGVLQRFEQLEKWVYNGRPKAYWMTGFFNAQGFLTAVRQEVARKHSGWALDDVVLATDVMKFDGESVKEAPSEGAYIHGLWLDGCDWSRKEGKLVDSTPKVVYYQLPVLYVTGALASDKKRDVGTYSCPVYINKVRGGNNFIFAADLRTDEDPKKWTLRGVCLLCTKD